MDQNYDNENLSEEEQEEFRKQMEEAARDPDNPDHEFATQGMKNHSSNFPTFSMGGVIDANGKFHPMNSQQIDEAKRMVEHLIGNMDNITTSSSSPVSKSTGNEYQRFGILGGEYYLQFVSSIMNEDREVFIYGEVLPNPNFDGQRRFKDLIAVMDFLQTSQLINFHIARNFGVSAWDPRQIHYSIRMDGNNKKIMLLAKNLKTNPPDWVTEIAKTPIPEGRFIESDVTNFDNSTNIPMLVSAYTRKSNYEPLVIMDITLAILSDYHVNFGTPRLNFTMIYNRFVHPFIVNAINEFYPEEFNLVNDLSATETSVRVYFETYSRDNQFQVRLYISPNVIPLSYPTKREIHYYEYRGHEQFGLGPKVEYLDDEEIAQEQLDTYFTIETFHSTPNVQTVVSQIEEMGMYNHWDSWFQLFKMNAYYFPINTMIPADWSDIDRIDVPVRQEMYANRTAGYVRNNFHNTNIFFTTDKAKTKLDYVFRYCIPKDRHPALADNLYAEFPLGTGTILYGFVDIYSAKPGEKTFRDLGKEMQETDTIMAYMDLPPNFADKLQDNQIGFDRVYANNNQGIIRFALVERWEINESQFV